MAARFPILYLAEADPEEAILSSGALAYLVEAMPQASFTVVGSPASAPLFAETISRIAKGESVMSLFSEQENLF